MSTCPDILPNIPHKIWRALAKKKRRSRRRQALAHQRRSNSQKTVPKAKKSAPAVRRKSSKPVTTATAAAADHAEAEAADNDDENAEQNRLWQAYDAVCVATWTAKQADLQRAERAKHAERERIQAEFEARERRAAEARQERVRRAAEKLRQYERLQARIEAYLGDDRCAMPEELRTGCTETQPGREECRMFARTGACRFGDEKCTHNHRRPAVSKLLLMPQLFVLAVAAERRAADEEKEYVDFFWDILPEVHELAAVTQFRVCRNRASHLAGNLLIEFESERSALLAKQRLTDRFYAGVMLRPQFCHIESWKSAVCGLSLANRCLKSVDCNYLHVFKNPNNKFPFFETATRPQQSGNLIRSLAISNEAKPLHWENLNDLDPKRSKTRQADCSNPEWRWSESPPPATTDKRTDSHSPRSQRSESKKRSRSRTSSSTASSRRKRSPPRFSSKHSKSSRRRRSRSRSRSSSRHHHRKHRSSEKRPHRSNK